MIRFVSDYGWMLSQPLIKYNTEYELYRILNFIFQKKNTQLPNVNILVNCAGKYYQLTCSILKKFYRACR